MCMCHSKGTFSLFLVCFQSGGGGGGGVYGQMVEAEALACCMEVYRSWKMEIVSKTCMGC